MEELLRLVPVDAGSKSRKERGAYYTDRAIAAFLVGWSVTRGDETVLDPSFGEGVFLREAVQRIMELGGDPSCQVYGIEIDSPTHRAFSASAHSNHIVKALHRNFFELRAGEFPPADAVVGNPPFIRYQRFTGEMRRLALRRASEAGVTISNLTSSWAPFVVHAIRFVKAGGKLAMVVPAELAYASYAKPVLDYIRHSFSSTRLLSFERKLFPNLAEDTILLLAAGRGEPFESFGLIDLPDLNGLTDWSRPSAKLPESIRLDATAMVQGRERVLQYLLPPATLDLYRELQRATQVVALGQLAKIGIGYVTGDNDFFHLDKNVVSTYSIPRQFLRPAVRNGSNLLSLAFTGEDWERLHEAGVANLLLHIGERQNVPGTVQRYLLQGVRRGVPERYKCRVRSTWYCVPHVYDADCFLTYMSGAEPKLVANEAGAVAPNTLHTMQFHSPLMGKPRQIAAFWQTSLTALACELEGHSLGGGMLKLEPAEARRVVVAMPELDTGQRFALTEDVDRLLRTSKGEAARDLGDEILLRGGLGLSDMDVGRLREGWRMLQSRRLNR